KGVDEKTVLSEIGHVFSVMSKYVEENIKDDNSFHEIPHVTELLVELEKRGDMLGLVTGNVEKIARLKLQKVGLLDFFKVGGFGDSSENRSELVLKAIKNAEEKSGRRIDKNDVFVIGDTPLDVQCGKEVGVKTIAMGTGPYTPFELKKHGSDYAFADFSEKDRIIQAIHKD
ncbi:MAG: HAD hydrolase-like protein, partial [Candidatus Aenigmarchaeota archaeon]|nr:HAD hydrolase-like protein [Candidatus Aenigmarchaeota archaeon]